MKYIYGPVPSRRLGVSLGVDIVPLKTCTLGCIYCQVGKTTNLTISRQAFFPPDRILEEIKEKIQNYTSKIDIITFSGSGEPTLNSSIGIIIEGIKKLTNIPVCVITNSTMMWDAQVRNDISETDIVMPSLDSANEHTFQVLSYPHPELKIKEIIEGLVRFRKEYTGKIWLEIMFVNGINDSPEELIGLRDSIKLINPDAINLNTVVRPPYLSFAKPVTLERMEQMRNYFGEKAEIIASFSSDIQKIPHAGIDEIREYLKRRPGTIDDITNALGIEKDDVEIILDKLSGTGEIIERDFFKKRFWEHNTTK